MKTVKIINPKTSEAVTIQSNATNFGELKAEITALSEFGDLNLEECRVFLKDSRIKKTLGLASDTLTEDAAYKIFISPIKMKAGANPTRYSDATVKDIHSKVNRIFIDILEGPECTDCSDVDVANSVTEEDLDDFDDIVYEA